MPSDSVPARYLLRHASCLSHFFLLLYGITLLVALFIGAWYMVLTCAAVFAGWYAGAGDGIRAQQAWAARGLSTREHAESTEDFDP